MPRIDATPTIRRAAFTLAAIVALAAGCARMPETGLTTLKARSFGELEPYLEQHPTSVEEFRLRGPFPVVTRANVELPVSASQRVAADLYLSNAPGKAPLVILLHGHDNSKDDHAYQAMHLATWGLHTLVLQLPNHGPWVRNGKTLAAIVDLLRESGSLLDPRVDTNSIVLAGHSFGAFAVAVALAQHAPVLGAVLLDPATVGRGAAAYLRRVDKPVMMIGADERVSVAHGRSDYYRHIPRAIAEISIRGAAHEDAEFPLDGAPGDGAERTEEHQVSFASALTVAAFSLAATGGFDYAWRSFAHALQSGTFMNPRKK